MNAVPKKNQNKRLSRPKQRKQQQLLEVSIRADEARKKRIKAVARAVFGLALVVGIAAGAWFGGKAALRRLLWENPTYFLTDVRVSTDGTLTREQILQTAGVVEGRHILQLDLDAARKAIDALPQVERVDLNRTLPNRVDILIQERQPIAWVAARGDADPTASDRSFLIDARGVVMRPRKLLPEFMHLPIISGMVTEDLAAGQKVTTLEAQAALELLRLNADSTRWQARNVDVSKGYCLVVTDRSRAQITFGLDGIEAQLQRLHKLLDHIAPTQREVQTVNLLVERNTPVTFVEPPAPEELPADAEAAGDLPPGAAKADAASGVKADGSKAKASPASKAESKKSASAAKKSEPVSSKAKAAKDKEKSSTPAKKKPGANDALKKPFRLNG